MRFDNIFLRKYVNWKELETAIEKLPTEQDRGYAFEEFVKFYFTLQRDYYQISEIYPEKVIPKKYREQLKLESRDYGVDGIFIKTDTTVTAYQAKFRTGRKMLTARELSTFWAEGEYAAYRLIITNSEELPQVSKKKSGSLQIVARDFDRLDSEFFENLQRMYKGLKPTSPKRAKPDDFQQRMLANISSGFQKSNKGKLIAACGIGKTLISLWVIEQENLGKILFLAPSLALIKQTLEEWSKNSKTQFSYLCVCSDKSVDLEREQDIADLGTSEIDFPVTTDPKIISKFLVQSKGLSIIFATYHSTDSVIKSMNNNNFKFDMIIFDEAHRTAGTKNSEMFSLALDDEKLSSKKRLFMTATERIIQPWVKQRVEKYNQVVFSMDDESIYGPVFDRYTFGQAIKDGLISDYKLIITSIDRKNILELIDRNRLLSENSESERNVTAENLYKQIVLLKAIERFNLKKIITFHSSVKNARNFITGAGNTNFKLEDLFDEMSDIELQNSFFTSVDGKMSAGERSSRLIEFERSNLGIVSNARCLTEGIDIPLIDSVYFVDPKNSMVDIVQACGRALRKPRNGKNKGNSFFIVPIIIDDETSVEDLDDERFQTIHNVIQALRDQDERLADWIDSINIGVARGGGSSHFPSDKIQIYLPKQFDLKSFTNAIELRIATINRNPTIKEKRDEDRTSSNVKTFMPFGDYTHGTYFEKLVKPTIKKFKRIDDKLSAKEIKINHNNVSHTERVNLIEKSVDGKYRLTTKGKQFQKGKIIFKEIMKESMLNFQSKLANELYPYRTLLHVLIEIEKINYIEFLYGLYTLPNSEQITIDKAINLIKEIRESFSNFSILNQQNKKKVLNELNQKYDKQYSFDEVWGSTTTRNKFGYFKNHLKLFDGIIESGNDILLEKNKRQVIQKLLEKLN